MRFRYAVLISLNNSSQTRTDPKVIQFVMLRVVTFPLHSIIKTLSFHILSRYLQYHDYIAQKFEFTLLPEPCLIMVHPGKTVTPAQYQMSSRSLYRCRLTPWLFTPTPLLRSAFHDTLKAAFGIEPVRPRVFREVRLNSSRNRDTGKNNDHLVEILQTLAKLLGNIFSNSLPGSVCQM